MDTRTLHIGGRFGFDGVDTLGIEIGEGIADAQRGVWDRTQAAPFKAGPQFKGFRHQLLCLEVALAGDDAGVLVFHLRPALVELADRHQGRLHDVEWLESGDHNRLLKLLREVFIRRRANDR